MSHAQSSGDERLPSAPGQRACDECRTRKIRCDRKRPCTHCRAASLACRTTATRPEQKSRVMVSKQYEEKIDKMDSRLASIEQLLRSLSMQASAPATHDTESIASSSYVTPDRRVPTHNVGTGVGVHLAAAKELFEKTVGDSPKLQQSVAEALQALQGIVERLDVAPEISNADVPLRNPIDITPPPWEQVAPILQRASEPGAGVANWATPCNSVAEFAQKARRLYDRHHTEIPSRRLSVYAGLFGLCCEFGAIESKSEDTLDRARYYYDLSQIFEPLVLRTIAELPMILPQTKESVEALLSGSIVTTSMCKPGLSWALGSAAIGLCQSLNYHRYSSMENDNEYVKTSKTLLFWMAYAQDRTVSLRLGRAPSFQDSYISMPKPQASMLLPQSLVPMITFWIESAGIQGEICEKLYSPAGALHPAEQRNRIAHDLATRMQALWDERQEKDRTMNQYFDEHAGSIAQLMTIGDEVMYLGSMALIMHATVPTSAAFISPALHYARKFLQAIRDTAITHCKNSYTWAVYCHWCLLNIPLTPFTIMFCEVISHHQNCQDDLQLMRSYVASLHPACHVSSGVQRFYELCSVFLRVAEAYIASKIAEEASRSEGMAPVTGEFDEYLTSLGLAPFPQSTNMRHEPDMSAYLQDWYTGNASLYGLLDTGLPEIEMSGIEVDNLYEQSHNGSI